MGVLRSKEYVQERGNLPQASQGTGWTDSMGFRREAAYGFLMGAALGGSFRLGQWLIEMGTHRDLTDWMPVAYIGLLAILGSVSGSLWAVLKEQAITDSLTGLYNRRYLSSVLGREVARVRRTGSALSVLILDVDDFKSINDRFGHHEGDRVLRRVADALRSACRSTDLVVRWGGEEFAVILPDTDVFGAQQAAHRLAGAVQAKAGVSVSIGWATFPDEAEEELLAKADERMYYHKRAKGVGQRLAPVNGRHVL